MNRLAIIGGSGLYELDNLKQIAEHSVETPYGKTSDLIIEAELEGSSAFFLPRHGRGHRFTPSEVNYRANIFALKKLGVTHILSVSAVGSLKEELPPRTFFLPDQFIDWTKGLRKRSFFEEGMVGHVSNAYPIEKNFKQFVSDICKNEKINYSENGSYVCIEGPQFSTRAESLIYRSFGASVIGMTNVPEAFLAKEAGMAYCTVAMVTDYDCWKEEDHCTVDEILKVMKDNNLTAKKLIKSVILSFKEDAPSYDKENQYAVITSPDKISKMNQDIIEVLLK